MTSFAPYFNPGTGEEIEYLVTAEESNGELVRYRWKSVAGARIPEHMHPHQEERFTSESGVPHFTLGGSERVGAPGETIVIPAGTWHAEWNPGSEDVTGVVELSPAMESKELHEMFAGMVNDGIANEQGVPRNPLQLGVTYWHFRNDIRVAKPPPWLQNLFLPPLAAIGRLAGLKPYYERWDSRVRD